MNERDNKISGQKKLEIESHFGGNNSVSLHHIGFAVRSFETSCPAFEALGANFFHTTVDEERNLDFCFADFSGGGIN